jgi:hypothetical protein
MLLTSVLETSFHGLLVGLCGVDFIHPLEFLGNSFAIGGGRTLVLDELLVLFFKGLRFGQEAATLLSSINRSKKLRTRKTHLFQQISQLLAIFLLEILIVGARLRAPVVNNLSYVISLDGNRGQTVK